MSSDAEDLLPDGLFLDLRKLYDRLNSQEKKYEISAYAVLLSSFCVLLENRKDKTVHEHFSPTELVGEFVKLSKKKFGPYAYSVMKSWGVFSAGDLGRMAFALQRAGVFVLAPGDTQEKFEASLELEEAASGEYKVEGPFPDVPGIIDTLPFEGDASEKEA